MSFWFRRRDKEGRVHWYAVDVPLLVVITLIGIVTALLLSLVAWLRAWLRGLP